MDSPITPAMAKMMLPEDAGPRAKNALGKEEFLKLLLTQMQHQDPMKPMDHQEFTTQLAQFSSLEQLSNIGKGIEGMQNRQDDGTRLQALTMIGKKIQATQQELRLIEGQPISLHHNLAGDVTPNNATIYDMQGNVVREMSLKKSDREIVWDGKDNNGKKMPSGSYGFRIQGTDSKGVGQESSGDISGVVMGVETSGKNPMLVIDTGNGKTKITMDKINQVSLHDEKAPTLSANTTKSLLDNKPITNPEVKTSDLSEINPTKETEVAEEPEFNEDMNSRFTFPLIQP